MSTSPSFSISKTLSPSISPSASGEYPAVLVTKFTASVQAKCFFIFWLRHQKKKNVSLTVVPIRKLWSYSNAKFMSCTLNMVLSALLKYFFNTPCFQVYRYSFYYLLVSVSGSVSTSQSASNSQSQSASISPSVSASVSGESTMILNQLVRKSSILFSSRYILVFQSWPFV